MTKGEKQAMYAQGTERHSFDTDDFTTIDTLFSLAEAYLFMQARPHPELEQIGVPCYAHVTCVEFWGPAVHSSTMQALLQMQCSTSRCLGSVHHGLDGVL